VALAHAFIDAGADVVWGHHPHVLQGAELYHGHPILYSMGNLVSPTPAVGGLIKLQFDGSKFRTASFIPTRIQGGRVAPVRGSAARARDEAYFRLCSQTAAKVGGESLFTNTP
jgi:poly-gamma-glutamate synthesis protein (capsule biosynthesis protein)